MVDAGDLITRLNVQAFFATGLATLFFLRIFACDDL